MFMKTNFTQIANKNVMVDLLLLANLLWGACYAIAFAMSPSWGDFISTYHTCMWFFILDLVREQHSRALSPIP